MPNEVNFLCLVKTLRLSLVSFLSNPIDIVVRDHYVVSFFFSFGSDKVGDYALCPASRVYFINSVSEPHYFVTERSNRTAETRFGVMTAQTM